MRLDLKHRRGFALLAALWLIVIITTIVLEFGLEAHERRATAINLAERAQARAAAMAGIETARAYLTRFIIQVHQGLPVSGPINPGILNPNDPLLTIDSIYRDAETIGGARFAVHLRDGGEFLNINRLTADMWRNFLIAAGLGYDAADRLAQSILNWRGGLTLPRGATRSDYLHAGALVLPPQKNFTDVSELRNVMGMTPDLYAKIAPYLSVNTSGEVTLNHADGMVLHALSGLTNEVVATILAQRHTTPFFWTDELKRRFPPEVYAILEQNDALFRPFVSNGRTQEALAISTGWAPGGRTHVTVVARLGIYPINSVDGPIPNVPGQLMWWYEE